MIAKIKFKELKYNKGGSFKPYPDAQTIEYSERYTFKFADVSDDGELFEGEAKIDVENKSLIDKLSKFKPFDDITVEMYIQMKPKYTIIILKDVILEDAEPDERKENSIN